MREDELAVQLPPGVAPEAGVVAGIVVAHRLPLSPVAKVVQPHHADRPGHADEGAEINAGALQPERTLEAVMDKAAMHSD